MSAICGIYRENTRKIADMVSYGMNMMSHFTAFPYDAANTWHNSIVFLGNVSIFITPESKFEILPRFSLDGKVAITADSIIDNREELLTEFSIPKELTDSVSDSDLIIRAYLRWGNDCPKHIIGDYAFAIWDERDETVFCARDHVGKRTFYYHHANGIFAFSTLLNPLLIFNENRRELNEEWIADNLATSIPLNQLSTSSTVFKGIYQLPPAHSLHVTKTSLMLKRYWDPLKTKKLRLNCNEEYEEAFRRVFFEAVKCRIRSIDSVGILLSSGLDSGAVGCIAALLLKSQGKKLKAYTSVPVSNYIDWLGADSLANESSYIQSILELYDNIEINYSDSAGSTAYNSLEKLMNIIEFPFKYVQNLYWIDYLTSLAKKDKCLILLDGQYGNYTVSSGSLETYFCTMISKGRIFSAIKEVKFYSEIYKRNYWSVLLHLISLYIPDQIINILKRYYLKTDSIASDYVHPLINPQFAASWNIDKKLKKYGFGKHVKKNSRTLDINRFSAEALLFSQTAEAEVKLSLAHGVIRRDPTRDKRVIEFCMSLPEEQLVQKGIERSLIRRATNGILPDKIRLNNKVRGAQSADWIQRMKAEWNQIRTEFLEALEDSNIQNYVDTYYARSLLEDIHDDPPDHEYVKMQMLLNVVSWKRFLHSYNTHI